MSYPSSLQGHSDFPTPLTPNLAGFTQLDLCLLPSEYGRDAGISGPTSAIFHRMPLAIPRVPCRCFRPLLPYRRWPSPNHKRIGVYSEALGFIPHPGSPSYIRPVSGHGAAPFALCYGLRFWPAPLAGYNPQFASVLGTVSGQVQPMCYHMNPPPAYTSKRATDVATSFQVARYRSRDLAL